MSDYRQVFGDNVALGLGLRTSPPALKGTREEYQADPAAAFSRMAEAMIPGGDIPVPFANQVTWPSAKSSV